LAFGFGLQKGFAANSLILGQSCLAVLVGSGASRFASRNLSAALFSQLCHNSLAGFLISSALFQQGLELRSQAFSRLLVGSVKLRLA
jgi:hypothetical protein